MKGFKSNQFKFLKYLNVPSESSTFTSYYGFGLPDTSCLETFKSNATPEQARFTVYGTMDDNGVFIPGNNNWVKNLIKIKTLPGFYWSVQTSSSVFRKCRFNDVPLKNGVIIKHYKVETKDLPSDLETEDPPSDSEPEWLPHESKAIEYDENRFIKQQKENRKKQQKQSKK